MKKCIVTILAFVYLVSSAGATVNTHYCMGKIYSVDLSKAKDDCSKCGMKRSSNHCCNTELKTLKACDSHNTVVNNINLSTPVFAISYNLRNNIYPDILTGTPSFATNNNSPPGSSGFSLCIFHCIFRL